MNKIPEMFLERMKNMLDSEFPEFEQSYQETAYQGLRVNTLKLSVEQFLSQTSFSLEPIPWCPSGFYYTEQNRPGKHPYHAAGLYYIQEPSAMSVVEVLQPEPGEKVLDLCAAPGGKSTQIAAYLQGEGLLIANEIYGNRVKSLSENIERCGIKNTLVTNETPARLAERFPAFFDRILVDAPCSGEGMFRKLAEACTDWSTQKVQECADVQAEILDDAAQMLKPGGVLVYSTCTFSPNENESSIAQFLKRQPEFELLGIEKEHGMSSGNPQWGNNRDDLQHTVRLWPHHLKGEGHFIAKLQKKDGEIISQRKAASSPIAKESLQLWKAYQKEFLQSSFPETGYIQFGDQLYLLPPHSPELNRLKVVRPGLHLGTLKKGRFEPSHALALALRPWEIGQSQSFSQDSEQILRYLKGESLINDSTEKGWTVVCVDGYPLGWGKVANGQMKNHYPKGLRWL
ncbi:RsmF rRNA methyltransferase first C-terminal domain-containing protein [Ammoniphilus resinae]|uniref:NOL1/NOP2/sun family putative RNA methylase n=1 Tax=Ammoniphilus resinae TaxID=861532 RepID=A0ABS4GVN4_9BACL|nr:RsmB/NOP family class I SAM-dependent RNA methyltransferase [Ammoniphilus resinae]MBP1933940.1 NOL1/NOP2/sun family putative RNA methylase [Ammoniphilus resinae]